MLVSNAFKSFRKNGPDDHSLVKLITDKAFFPSQYPSLVGVLAISTWPRSTQVYYENKVHSEGKDIGESRECA